MKKEAGGGKYLLPQEQNALEREKRKGRKLRRRRYMTVTVLLLWDGLLLYMIIHCLIDGVYGAAFIAVLSVYLGYTLQ